MPYTRLLVLIIWCFLTSAVGWAQGPYLQLQASEVPDALNVCAGTDRWVVTVRTPPGSTTTVTDLTATAALFAGVELDQFDAAASTPGVTLAGGDPGAPQFALPAVGPDGLASVAIAFTVRAGCGYTDTLAQNNQVLVRDTWTLDFTLPDGTGQSEQYATVEYRDAFAQPFLSIDISNDAPPLRIGECFERKVQISNSALAGYAESVAYSVRQGGGTALHRIELNGQALALTRTPLPGGDTLVATNLAVDQLSAVNDGNGRLDPDETVELVEFFCVTNCALPSTSLHRATWGCNGDVCAEVLQTDIVPLGEGTPNPTFEPSGSLPNLPAGYCANGQLTVTFANGGIEFDAGFGTMNDVQLGLAFGAGYLTQQGPFRITGVTVAGVPLIIYQGVNTLDGHPQFAADPDGPGGLTDSDGDGFFDDLPINESVEITAFYTFDCVDLTQVMPDDNCINDVAVNFFSRIDYRDRCLNAGFDQRSNFYRASNRNGTVDNFTDPDARAELDTFFLVHQQTRAINNFDAACSDGQLEIRLAKPAGIHAVPGLATLTYNGFAPLTLLSTDETADSLIYAFATDAALDLNGEYELRLGLAAACDALPGPTRFPLSVAHFCPGCACRHLWYCGELDGPSVQIVSPPCTMLDCAAGLQIEAFEVARTSFGYADAAYTLPADPAAVNTAVAISCDSVRMRWETTVGMTALADSVGLLLSYDNIDGSDDGAPTFLYGTGTVAFVQGGQRYACSVDTLQHTVVLDSITQRHRIDLSACLAASGLVLQPGDSILFEGLFSVNPDGAYDVQFETLPNFRASGYGILDGQVESCGSLGEVFTVAKTLTAFDFPTNDDFPTGCAPTQLDYRLITINNGFSTNFPNEFRPAVKVDSFQIDFDPALLAAFDSIEVTGALPGHPVHGDAFFPLPSLTEFPDGRYRLYFDTLSQVPSLNAVQTYAFDLRITLVPNCGSAAGSSAGDHIFDFNPEISYVDRYYALTIGEGDCATVRQRAVNNDLVYTEPPAVALTAVSNADQLVAGDTVVWELQLCNTSFESDAGVSWLALDADSAVTVLEITDISDPAIDQAYAVRPYGNGNYFAISNGLRKANGVNGFNATCNRYRVRALVNRCGTLPLTARSGYNCAPYPADWTPAEYPPCLGSALPLSVTTLTPFLEAEVADQTATPAGVCDTQTVTILLRNDDRGAAFDLQTTITLPLDGATLIPGSVAIAYPSGAAFEPAPFDPAFAGTTPRGQVYRYAGFDSLHTGLAVSGLPGFDPNVSTDSNELRLRYRFVTDCAFTSGALAFYSFEARSACGAATNFEAGETLPLYLDGAAPDSDKSFALTAPTAAQLPPDGAGTLVVEVRNLTATPTDADDQVRVDLPPGLSYVAGSSSSDLPGGYLPGDPQISTNGGMQQLAWAMPTGVGQNERIRLRFEVLTDGFACGETVSDLRFYTSSQVALDCGNTGTACAVGVLNTDGGTQVLELPIGGNLGVQITSALSDCTLDFETIQLSGTVSSSTGDLAAGDYVVRYYYDVNGDGTLQAADSLLGEYPTSLNVPAAGFSFDHAVATRSAWVCDLLVQVAPLDPAACAAGVVSKLPLPQLRGAGVDVVVCAASPQTLTYQAGDPACANQETDYLWTALPPAQVGDLSDVTSAAPLISYAHPGTGAPTLTYVLRATRGSCGIPTYDTLRIERPGGAELLSQSNDTTICSGSYADLELAALGTNLTYTWNPAPLIGQGTARVRVAPLVSTQYSVTVTGSAACETTATFNVSVGDCIPTCVPPQLSSTVVTAASCGTADGSILLSPDAPATDFTYDWLPDTGTPNAAGNGREGLGYGAYTITVRRADDPTCSTETIVLVQHDAGPLPTVSTTPATCALSDGSAALLPAAYGYSWPDGATQSVRDDLPGGTYPVTVTDPADPDCPNVVAVTIGEINPLAATVTFDQLPGCGGSNGAVTLTVAGGSGSYTYDWPGGSAAQTALTEGMHTVEIADAVSGCTLPFSFVLPAAVPNASVFITDTIGVSCAGATDGGVVYTLDFAPGFAQPAAVRITNGFAELPNNQLPGGQYCLEVQDADGCVAGGACFAVPAPDALRMLLTATPACAGGGSLAASVSGGTAPYRYDWAHLPGTDEAAVLDGLSAGTYSLTVEDANGCMRSTSAMVVPCADCPVFEQDTVFLPTGCGEPAELCLTVDPAAYDFAIGGAPYTDTPGFCAYDTLGVYAYAGLHQQGAGGPYAVQDWTVNGQTYNGTVADLDALIDSLRQWDPAADWRHADFGPFLIGAAGGNYPPLVLEVLSLGIQNTLPFERQLLPTGRSLSLPLGNYYFTATQTARTCTDSVFVRAFCTNTDTLFLDLTPGDTATLCFDADELPGAFASLGFGCLDNGNSMAQISADSCLLFSALSIGVDTACVTLCDTLGFCDSSVVVVNVGPLIAADTFLLTDTVLVGGAAEVLCFDQDLLPGPPTELVEVCPNTNAAVSFALNYDSYCVLYAGLSAGTDTLCVQLVDALGNSVQYTLVVTALEIRPTVVKDTLFVREDVTFCLPTDRLPGAVVSVAELCPDLSSGAVDFFVDPIDYCVEYTGLQTGRDTACVAVCDAAGNCDTTYFCLLVQPFFDPPTANVDSVTTQRATPVIIDIKANDILLGGLDTAYLVAAPNTLLSGEATLNPDCSVTYNPDPAFCDRFDRLQYAVCNAYGCDTTEVVIFINCIELTVFTAVSPNNDGFNDFFHISKIEDFPDNRLRIYNRWGNLVYERREYENDWPGQFSDATLLPDGAYFYLLEWRDNEAEFVQRGYLELFR